MTVQLVINKDFHKPQSIVFVVLFTPTAELSQKSNRQSKIYETPFELLKLDSYSNA